MAHRKQGYNARLDESLGSRNRGRKSQSLKSRRDESKGTEKAKGKRAYSAVGTMDKGSRRKSSKRVVNLGAGGRVGGTKASRNSDLTSQHKRLAMGERVPQGKAPVRMQRGGTAAPRTAARRAALVNTPLGAARYGARRQAAAARRPVVDPGPPTTPWRGKSGGTVKKLQRGGRTAADSAGRRNRGSMTTSSRNPFTAAKAGPLRPWRGKKGGAVRMRGGGAVRGAVKKATVKKTKKGSSSRRGG